ncbi:aromatic ring-opening dioxygenase LigA [Streptomyces niveiscabiei]|uniref:Aromatic ring-opening dioxygenase LigA n=1 Tax=Streptomyces niveiscabiei TaxID=164115 RepID=A0ABW9I3Z0_9ACTN
MSRATAASLAAMRRRLDEPPPEPVPGQLAVEAPAAKDKPPSCEDGNPRCGVRPVRFYPCGYRCDEHQPSRTHRRPETRHA